MAATTHLARLGAALGAALLDFVYPPHCPGCGTSPAPDDREALCRTCRAELLAPLGERCAHCGAPWVGQTNPVGGTPSSGGRCANCAHWPEMAFDRALVLAQFTGVAHDAIHALKFGGIRRVGPFLGSCIAAHPELRAGLADIELLVPVPLHPARHRERGFNQATEIARGLGGALGVAVRPDLVRRRRATRQQALLDASERAANLAQAFAPSPGPKPAITGAIGLVDDVLTTGATLSACAEALGQAVPGAPIRAIAVASPFRRPAVDRRCVDLIQDAP